MTEQIDFLQLRDFAVSTAKRAAELITSRRAELVAGDGIAAHTQTKSSNVDPVTEVDTAAEDFIATTIRTARPGDGIFGEEGSNVDSTSGVTWIVDPIDGTVNFLYGVPDFAVSIGAEYQGHLVAGAVVNVARGRTYAAAAGQGATVTGPDEKPHPLRCGQTSDPALALVATGFGYGPKEGRRKHNCLLNFCPKCVISAVSAPPRWTCAAWLRAPSTLILSTVLMPGILPPGQLLPARQVRWCTILALIKVQLKVSSHGLRGQIWPPPLKSF